MSEQDLARRARHRLAIIHHAEEITGQRGDDLLLRDQPAHLLLLVPALSEFGDRRPLRSIEAATRKSERNSPGCGRENLVSPSLPLRSEQDPDVPGVSLRF